MGQASKRLEDPLPVLGLKQVPDVSQAADLAFKRLQVWMLMGHVDQDTIEPMTRIWLFG